MSLPVLSVPIKKAEAGNCWHSSYGRRNCYGSAGEKGRGIFYGEQRRCPPCPRLPEKRLQSYAVGYGAAGTEAAQEKCVYFDRPAVSGQLAVPWGNGIGSAHGYP